MIEWTDPGKNSDIRCPYCVENGNFRPMLRQTGGDWFFCIGCGHLALPSAPFFRCTCGKCVVLYGAVEEQPAHRGIHSALRRLFSPRWSMRAGSETGEN